MGGFWRFWRLPWNRNFSEPFRLLPLCGSVVGSGCGMTDIMIDIQPTFAQLHQLLHLFILFTVIEFRWQATAFDCEIYQIRVFTAKLYDYYVNVWFVWEVHKLKLSPLSSVVGWLGFIKILSKAKVFTPWAGTKTIPYGFCWHITKQRGRWYWRDFWNSHRECAAPISKVERNFSCPV